MHATGCKLLTAFLLVSAISDVVAVPVWALQQRPRGESEPAGKLPLRISSQFQYRAPPEGPVAPERVSGYKTRWAVVVGIDNYEPSGGAYTSLRFPGDDARAVLAALREQFGFKTAPEGVAIGDGVDDKRILATLKAWPPRDQVSARDLVVFFYAGHGSGQGDLVGCNGKPVPRAEIVSWMNDLPCQHKLLILDSCYAGNVFLPAAKQAIEPRKGEQRPGARVAADTVAENGPSDASTETDAVYNVFADYLHGDAFFALTAARLDKAADNGYGPHSVFAGALLETLHDRANSTPHRPGIHIPRACRPGRGPSQKSHWRYPGPGVGASHTRDG